jgi:hypothetical protein
VSQEALVGRRRVRWIFSKEKVIRHVSITASEELASSIPVR